MNSLCIYPSPTQLASEGFSGTTWGLHASLMGTSAAVVAAEVIDWDTNHLTVVRYCCCDSAVPAGPLCTDPFVFCVNNLYVYRRNAAFR